MTNDLKKRNIVFLFLGVFFTTLSWIMVSFFIPFFLKEQGLGILEIGLWITLGLAFGGLILSIMFGYVQRKIKIRNGLFLGGIFDFISSSFVFVFPTKFGAFGSNLFHRFQRVFYEVSSDVALQHNTTRKNKRIIGSIHLFVQTLAFAIGLVLAVILIKNLGFRWPFLIFALFSIPAIIFYFNVRDDTRFKIREKAKLPKIDRKLKIFLLSRIIYEFALSASFALVITFLVTDLFGQGIEWIALLFIVLYVSIALTTYVTKNILDRVNWIRTSMLGMFILLLSAVVVILSENIYFVLLAMILEGVGAGIWAPSHEAQYWKMTKPSLREKVSGFYRGIMGFVKSIGPLAGGWIVATFGILGPFYMKVGLALVSILLYWYVLRMD